MGRGIALSEAQWDELDRVRLTTDSADVRLRTLKPVLPPTASQSPCCLLADQ
jgi:hypothetical protein